MDAAEALFDAVRVPRQVVVDHQVRALKVDSFAGGVRGQKDLHFGIVLERLLGLHPLFTAHGAVDHDHRFLAPEYRRDPVLQVTERVAMLGEQNQFLVRRWRRRRDRAGTIGNRGFRDPAGHRHGREHGSEQLGQFAPLPVIATAAERKRQRLQSLQRSDLRLEFGNRARRGRLIENLLFGRLDFVVGRVLQILNVLGIQFRRPGGNDSRGLIAPLEQLQLPQLAFQPFAPAAEGFD